jgi:HSP20 family protein
LRADPQSTVSSRISEGLRAATSPPARAAWRRFSRSNSSIARKGYRLTSALPGLSEKEVEIIALDSVHSLSGEKKRVEEAVKDNGILLSTHRYGAFQRKIQLPADVDPDDIKAHFKNGVLSITLAKDEKATTRTCKIATANA